MGVVLVFKPEEAFGQLHDGIFVATGYAAKNIVTVGEPAMQVNVVST